MPYCPICGLCYPRVDSHTCYDTKTGEVKQITEEPPRRFKRGLNVTKAMEVEEDGAGEMPEPEVQPEDV